MLVKMLANMLVPIANRTVAHLTTTITKFCNKIKKIHNKIKSSQQHKKPDEFQFTCCPVCGHKLPL